MSWTDRKQAIELNKAPDAKMSFAFIVALQVPACVRLVAMVNPSASFFVSLALIWRVSGTSESCVLSVVGVTAVADGAAPKDGV